MSRCSALMLSGTARTAIGRDASSTCRASNLPRCAALRRSRFLGYVPVSLQFPELAAEQLEQGMKQLGLVGAAIGGSVEGEEIAARRFDPFWKKAEELQALVFIHPQTAAQSTGITKRVQGSGA